jgi:hypothetical protein
MLRRVFHGLVAVLGLCVLATSASAEVKVQERTQFKFGGFLGGVMNVFGGKAAKEGVTSSVAVKGDRRVRLTDSTGEIVDLGEEKIYELDLKKKSYKVTTFAEYRKRLEEEEAKARQSAREAGEAEQSDPEPRKEEQPRKEVEVDFDVKETGQTKALNGFDTRQVVMTIVLREKGKTLEQAGGVVITSDAWLTKALDGNQELLDFEQRYFEKLHGPVSMAEARAQLAMLFATYPQLKDGMGRLTAESRRLEGTPVSTTLTIEAVKGAEAAAAQEEPQEKPKGLGGMLARKLAKKKESDGGKGSRSLLMSTTHEILSVTPAVADGDLAVPAGFKPKSE